MEIKGTKLFDGFVFLGQDFLDKRSRVSNMEQLKGVDPNSIPEGFKIFVQDTKTWYEYDSEYHSEITGNWKTSNAIASMDSDKFVYAILDSEGKVLWGIKVDGTTFSPTVEIGDVVFTPTNVDEFLWVMVDQDNMIVFGIKKDGSLYAPKGMPDEVKERFDELSNIKVLANTDNWLFAFVDVNDTVVWGIQSNGSIYQGKGIPEDALAEFKKVWSRLSDFDNLRTLENTGVWLLAFVDTEDKVVLGITKDGEVYQGKGIPEDSKIEFSKIYNRLAEIKDIQVLTNIDNWLFVIQDTQGNILFGIEKDGSIYQGRGVPEEAKEWLERLESLGYKVMSNDQYLYAICDSNDVVLFAIDYGGKTVVNGITGIGTIEVVDTDQWVYAIYDSKGNILFAIKKDGTTWMSSVDGTGATEISNEYLKSLYDEEFIHIIQDTNGKIVFAIRYLNGEVYIPVGMSEDAKKYFKQVEKKIASIEDDIDYLKKHGKDWSDEKSLCLPMPRVCARVDIVGTKPTSKYVQQTGTLTYSDMDGNSFTKAILWNVQGNISSGFDKKNWAIDLLNDPSDPDSSFSVQFGNWCPFDSFHLKAYISDFWKTRSLCVYRHAEQISQYRPYYNRRPWDTIFGAANQTADGVLAGGIGTVEEDTRSGALGRPEGFPVMLTINGKPYGLYTWNIKKDKDNYHVTKNDNNAKQLFFGDYMTGVFERYNNSYWSISNRNLFTIEGVDGETIIIPSYSSSSGAQLVVKNAVTSDGLTLTVKNSAGSTYTYPVYFNGNPVSPTNTWEAGDCIKILRSGNPSSYYFNATLVGKKWDEKSAYNLNDYVWDEETIDFEVNGIASFVTIRRLFKLVAANNTTFAGYEYDEQGYPCQRVFYTDEEGQQAVRRGSRIPYYNTMRPSYLNWRTTEVRNPKKTIVRYFTGNDEGGNPTYRYEYYDYDSPMDYSVTGAYDYTHEIISADMISQSAITKLMATGETENFSKKEYTRSCNTRAALDLYSYVIPILHTTLTAKNYFDWGFLTEATEENYQSVWDSMSSSEQTTLKNTVKKQIFTEHHDVDHNLDFFLVYNDTNYYDSITHNTLYTMYDGKHLIANLYDTDIALGMSSTYTNSFPAVATGVLGEGSTTTFVGWLYKYYKDEIMARWKEYRDNKVIDADKFADIVHELVESVGIENYKLEAQYWSQPGYRTPVYWRMPAGSLIALEDSDGNFEGWGYNEDVNSYDTMPAALKALYDADPTSVEYDETKQYVTTGSTEQVYCTVTKGDSVHWYQCTANCKGQDPTKTYTCGSPTSGGVIDSPRRTIEWFRRRVAALDSKWSYTPPTESATSSSIPASVIENIINA